MERRISHHENHYQVQSIVGSFITMGSYLLGKVVCRPCSLIKNLRGKGRHLNLDDDQVLFYKMKTYFHLTSHKTTGHFLAVIWFKTEQLA